jgi:arylformamidase
MLTRIDIKGTRYRFDLSKPLDISLPLVNGANNPNAYYAPQVIFEPVVMGDFIGDTKQGGAVNYKNVHINPHGNGTHTECLGHICSDEIYIKDMLQVPFTMAHLMTIMPTEMDNGDHVILPSNLTWITNHEKFDSIIIRTMYNYPEKKLKQYSGTNPPYLHEDAARFLVYKGYQHILIDLPSLDREEDGGALAAHKTWWQFDELKRTQSTVTELIYVDDSIVDGAYVLHLDVLNWELDCCPTRPKLYSIISSSPVS